MNKKIVELKNKLGLSRASFAKALDISPSQMARIEAGKVVLSDEFLLKVCGTFHVNPSFFTGEIDIDEAVSVVSPEEKANASKLTVGKVSSRVGLAKTFAEEYTILSTSAPFVFFSSTRLWWSVVSTPLEG